MLPNTFCHFPGVGTASERGLWDDGLKTWQALLERHAACPSALTRRLCDGGLQESIRAYEDRDLAFFAERLPSNQHWRLFADFRNCCAYVDIETTGLAVQADQVVSIALFDGKTIRHYVRDQNLEDFVRDVQKYRLLVSYNGKSFDVPFLESCFHTRLDHAHIDLRHVLRSLGYTGGLKGCEQRLGVARKGMEEMDGFMAVLLWRDYKRRKDHRVLETLLAYNVQDAVNLETLMVKAYNLKLAQTPFVETHQLVVPPAARNPFTAHADVIGRFAGPGRFSRPHSW
jgi:uncharacterized protein